jgi:SnoaL-like domain
MIDTADIRDLYTRYTYNGDRGRLADLAACFADDGTLEFPGGKGTGPVGVAEALSTGVDVSPARTFTRHHVTNPLIDLSDDGQNATGRAYFSVYCNNGLDHVGTYNDWLRLTPQGWRFAYRQVRIDWQSPTSMSPPITSR